jgi:integrase
MAIRIKFFTRAAKSDIVNIRVRVMNGKQYDLTALTGLQINQKLWNNDKAHLKQLAEITDSFKIKFNQSLIDLETAIKSECNNITEPDKLSSEQLKTIINKVNNPERYKEPEQVNMSLFAFIQHFIDTADTRLNPDTNAPISRKTKQEYNTSFNYLKSFAKTKLKEPDFEDIDFEFYKDYVDFMRGKNLGNNTVGKRIKTLKTFLNAATAEGINTNMKFKSRNFKVFNEPSDSIYLTKDELSAFYKYDFSKTPYLEKVRDLFIVGCLTGLRFSDLHKITTDDVKDGIIEIIQQKTGKTVNIPLHLSVWEIMKKYNNQLPKAISNQKFNEFLKEAAKKSEALNAEFTKATTKKGLKVSKTYQKHELISSHTARRTMCTNAYNDGIPTITIMAISGHKTESAFLKYIKLDSKEHAKKMLNIWRDKGEFLQKKAN